MIGCKLHGEQEAHAARSLAVPPRPPRHVSRLARRCARPPSAPAPAPPPARRAVDYFLSLSEIIVREGWGEGVSATRAAWGAWVRVRGVGAVNKLVWVFWLG